MEIARKSWELDNNVQLVDPTLDALYKPDTTASSDPNAARPWTRDPHHFKHVRISAVALLKMVMHARSGGVLEIMGCMQGYVSGDAFIVTDAFRLPVEGTETRVNAQSEANEYLVEYLSSSRELGRTENVVGWYHSHPGYGCWLSGIDVETQSMQQKWNDPFLAIVIDPDRTINSGKVDIGAFRTYPSEFKPDFVHPGDGSGEGSQIVPLSKAAEFGAHADKYYSVEISHFKSTLDTHLLELLWHKYWVQTLSQNPLLTNRDYGNKQLLDLASKISEATTKVTMVSRSGAYAAASSSTSANAPQTSSAESSSRAAAVVGGALDAGAGGSPGSKYVGRLVDKVAANSALIAANERAALAANEVKASVFNKGKAIS